MQKAVLFIHGPGIGAYAEDRHLADSLQRAQASHRHWRNVGSLSGLSDVEGLHLTLRTDPDQRDRESATLNGTFEW